MKQWEQYITKANHFYSLQNWVLAELFYLYAVEYADSLYRCVPNCDMVIIAFITSYHNLAYTYGQQNKMIDQKEALMYPYNQLPDRIRKTCTDDKIYIVLIKAINLCYQEIINYENDIENQYIEKNI